MAFRAFPKEQIRSLAFFEPTVPESFALWPGSNPSATQHLKRHWPQADRKGWAHALAAGLLESLRNLFQGWEEPAGAPPPITWRLTDFTLFPRLFLTPCLASCCPLWHNAPSPRLYLANSYSFCKIQLLSRTYCIMLGVCWKPFVCLLPPTGL